jgi:hypothetical protein
MVKGSEASNRLGHAGAGDQYLASVADIVNGSIKQYEKNWPEVLGPDGHAVDATDLLAASGQWKAAIARLIEETRPAE